MAVWFGTASISIRASNRCLTYCAALAYSLPPNTSMGCYSQLSIRVLCVCLCVQMRTSQTFLRDSTVTSPLALLLFGGQLEVVHGEGYVLVDGWIQIRAAAPTAVLVQRLRGGLDTLLQQRIKQPGLDWGAQAGELINTIIKLLQDEEATRQRER